MIFQNKPESINVQEDIKAVTLPKIYKMDNLYLEETFYEEVARFWKIDVLEPVTEPTEWANSYVIAQKGLKVAEINSSNAHEVGHRQRRN